MLKALGKRFARQTTYSAPVRALINHSPFDTHIDARDCTIERGCDLGGEILLGTGTTIEHGCKIFGKVETGSDVTISAKSEVTGDIAIGKRSNILEDGELVGEVSIGKYSAIARRGTFISRNHPTFKPGIQFKFYDEVLNRPLEHVSKGAIEVGSDVWIGAQVIVLSGVTIGNGAVVGAGSVVTRDVEPYAIVGGAPAKHRGWRFDEPTRTRLEELEWWNWDEEKIRNNVDFFDTDLRTVDDIRSLIE